MKTPLKLKKQPQSIWLMLGSAVLLSLGGWVAIVHQTSGPDANHAPVPTVVELPPPSQAQTAPHTTAANTHVPTTNETTAQSHTSHLRQVRPMLRSRSSN